VTASMSRSDGASAYSYRHDSAVPAFDDSKIVLVMDGGCALCSRGARWVSRCDKADRFRICPADSGLGQALFRHYGLSTQDPETWLCLFAGRALGGLDAWIAVGRHLGGTAGLLRGLAILPGPLRSWLYRRMARNRYALFGKTEMCALPDPELRRRLIG